MEFPCLHYAAQSDSQDHQCHTSPVNFTNLSGARTPEGDSGEGDVVQLPHGAGRQNPTSTVDDHMARQDGGVGMKDKERTDAELDLLTAIDGVGTWYRQDDEDAFLNLAYKLRAGGMSEWDIGNMLAEAYRSAIREHVIDERPVGRG